jgi:hypothetical protein
VIVGSELDELSNTPPDVVAITPDLLGAIAKEESDGGAKFNICYPFSGSFSNMTVSASITRG